MPTCGDLINNFRILSVTSQMRLFNGKYGEEIKGDVKNRPEEDTEKI